MVALGLPNVGLADCGCLRQRGVVAGQATYVYKLWKSQSRRVMAWQSCNIVLYRRFYLALFHIVTRVDAMV